MQKRAYSEPKFQIVSADELDHYLNTLAPSLNCGGGYVPGETETTPSEITNSPEWVFMLHFGFDYTTALAIHDLWKLLLGRKNLLIQGTANADAAAAYMFFRILGGFVYGVDNDADILQWNYTAGPTPGIKYRDGTVNGVIPSEKELIVSELGLSEWRYRLIRYKIRIQHSISAVSENDAKGNDDGALGYTWAELCSAYNERVASQIDETSFREDIWMPQAVSMNCKPDFAHLCITLATHLGYELHLDYGAPANAYINATQLDAVMTYGKDRARMYFAGWLGDVVLGNHTMGTDDYASDADALSLAEALPRSDFDVSSCLVSHYRPIDAVPPSRKEIFQQLLDLDDAVQVVSRIFFGETLTKEAFLSALAEDEKYEDPHTFFAIWMEVVPEQQTKLWQP